MREESKRDVIKEGTAEEIQSTMTRSAIDGFEEGRKGTQPRHMGSLEPRNGTQPIARGRKNKKRKSQSHKKLNSANNLN